MRIANRSDVEKNHRLDNVAQNTCTQQKYVTIWNEMLKISLRPISFYLFIGSTD